MLQKEPRSASEPEEGAVLDEALRQCEATRGRDVTI